MEAIAALAPDAAGSIHPLARLDDAAFFERPGHPRRGVGDEGIDLGEQLTKSPARGAR